MCACKCVLVYECMFFQRPERQSDSVELELQEVIRSPVQVQELNLGPLEKQDTLLIPEPSLQPCMHAFNYHV